MKILKFQIKQPEFCGTTGSISHTLLEKSNK